MGWELAARGGKGSKFVDLGQLMDPIKYVLSLPPSPTLSLTTFLLLRDGLVSRWNFCD